LHYTREDRQPWYNPKHPFAKIWESELAEAVRNGSVSSEDLQQALQKWGRKEDWRPFVGLHPYYRKFLELGK
jgi:hypothetical protein